MYQRRLSVIIPGYNTPQWMWERCLNSVLAAIGNEDEIICIDDGSIDFPYYLDEFSKIDKRIRVVHRENGGLSNARNTGILEASGRFVSFVDSDDEIIPCIYEHTLSYMKRTESDVGVFGVRVLWPDIKVQKVDKTHTMTWCGKDAKTISYLSQNCLFNYVWNKIYDRDGILQKSSANYLFEFDPEGMPCEDLIFNLNLAKEHVRWCVIDKPGYMYYRMDGTLLSSYKPTNVMGIQKVANVWKNFCEGDAVATEYFEDKCQISERSLYLSEWNNIWMKNTPYSLFQRYLWIKKYKSKIYPDSSAMIVFIKKLLYVFGRNYLYINKIRRNHIMKLYPNATSFD